MPDQISALAFQELVGRGGQLVDRINAAVDAYNAWASGTVDGGPNGDGYYPLPTAGSPGFRLVPCPALFAVLTEDQVQKVVTVLQRLGQVEADDVEFDTRLASIEAMIGDQSLIEALAYEVQNNAISAARSALDARLSEAQSFPADFAFDSKYWTGDNGQIAHPEVSANNPLPGSFHFVSGHGQVYRTPTNPESSSSFGPVGYIPGIPGTVIKMKARFRAITTLSNGANAPNTGVGILPLNDSFGLVSFIPGQGVGTITPGDGWKDVAMEFVVPSESDPQKGAYYRPTFFMNVVGQAHPLSPSLDTQGDQRFEIEYFKIEVNTPDAGSGRVSQHQRWDNPGEGTYVTPVGARRLRVRIKGGGGGGGGSGDGSGPGADGAGTSFGPYSVGGGKGGSNQTNGGEGGSSGAGWQNFYGQWGGPGAGNGFTYAPGGLGGGAKGGGSASGYPGQDAGWASGCGGGGAGAGSANLGAGGGGGEGGEAEILIDSPEESYAFSIGGGGNGGAPSTAETYLNGGKGAHGFLEVIAEF